MCQTFSTFLLHCYFSSPVQQGILPNFHDIFGPWSTLWTGWEHHFRTWNERWLECFIERWSFCNFIWLSPVSSIFSSFCQSKFDSIFCKQLYSKNNFILSRTYLWNKTLFHLFFSSGSASAILAVLPTKKVQTSNSTTIYWVVFF